MSDTPIPGAPIPGAQRHPFRSALLWLCAFVLTAAAAVYQRTTGPTYPLRGEVAVEGTAHRYRLVRSEETVRPARIAVPSAGGAVAGSLFWRRYPTEDPYTEVPLRASEGASPSKGKLAVKAESAGKALPTGEDELAAEIPPQPAAGKVEYHLQLTTPDGPLRIPAQGEDDIVLRFKDPVPGHFLWPHVLCMFVAILIGMRAGLSALVQPLAVRRQAWVALAVMTVGGLVLGPIVQKHAFGAYWTGWPNSDDLTDNKVLAMWLVWVVACAVVGLRPRRREGVGRIAVLAAAVVMIAVYLIPHSLRGSELDYDQLQNVENPHDAIRTGR